MKILLLILLPCFAFAQPHLSIVRDTIMTTHPIDWPHDKIKTLAVILSNDSIVYCGKYLTLGKGSLPNGDYNYIATPSNSMEAKLKSTTIRKTIRVFHIKRTGNKTYGYKYIFKCEGNFLLQLEDAIATGEIII